MGIWPEIVRQRKASRKDRARATTAKATTAKARATTAKARKAKEKKQIGSVITVGKKGIWPGTVGPKGELRVKERVMVMEARASGENELEKYHGRMKLRDQKVHRQKLVVYG